MHKQVHQRLGAVLEVELRECSTLEHIVRGDGVGQAERRAQRHEKVAAARKSGCRPAREHSAPSAPAARAARRQNKCACNQPS
jgi:hypothetical protein